MRKRSLLFHSGLRPGSVLGLLAGLVGMLGAGCGGESKLAQLNSAIVAADGAGAPAGPSPAVSTTVTLPANCGKAQVFIHTESATHLQTMTPAMSVGGGVFKAAVALPPEDRHAPPYFEGLLAACRRGAGAAEAVCNIMKFIPDTLTPVVFGNICAIASSPLGEIGFPACMVAFESTWAFCKDEGADIVDAVCEIAEDVQKYLSERGEPQYPMQLWATAKTDGQQGWSTSDRATIKSPVAELAFWIDAAQCCEVDVGSQQLNVAAQGGPVRLEVRAKDPTCPWSVVAGSAATWATPAPLSGVGSGAVVFSVAENKGNARVAPFTVAGKAVAVAEAAAPTTNPPPPLPQPPSPPSCVIKLGASRQEIPSSGGRNTLSVDVGAGCGWSASSGASWLKIDSGTGAGPGTVVYDAEPNSGAASRSATITVGGATAEIVQASRTLSCLYGTTADLAPKVPASGGHNDVKVVSSSSILCPIVAPVTAEPWVTLSPTSRTPDGSYQFTYSVAVNTGAARRGWIRLVNITIAIEQAGVPTQPPSPSGDACEGLAFSGGDLVAVGAAGGMASATVSTPAGCSWVVSSVGSSLTDPWLSMSRNGSVLQYSAKQNSTAAKRAGFITIKSSSGKVERRLVVMQNIFSWMPCRFGFFPWYEADAPAEGFSRTMEIDANTSLCDARAVPAQVSDPWVSASPLSNVIPGRWSINIGVASNPGPTARDGFLIVMDAVFKIRQAAKTATPPPPPRGDPPKPPPSCFYVVYPATIDAPTQGGKFAVKVAAACAWRAAISANGWLEMSPVSAGGGAAVTIFVQANRGGNRSGTITIGDKVITINQQGSVVAPLPPPRPPENPRPSCTYGVSPASLVAPTQGGKFAAQVTASCAWRAAISANGWFEISPASGSGSAPVTIFVQANRGGNRSGTITIGDKVLTINQQGTVVAPLPPAKPPENPRPSCTYGVSPASLVAPTQGGKFAAQVTASCAWRAAISANGWFEISPASGSGSAPVTIFVQANRVGDRTGTITIGDKVITINQQGTVVAPSPPPIPPPPGNGGSCSIPDPSRTRFRFVGATSLPADSARGIVVACPSGDVLVAGQRGSSAVIAKLDASLAARGWLANQEGLDVRGLAVPIPGEPVAAGAVYAAGIATLGQCGARDGVGDPEGKSVLSIFNAATGAQATCGSQTVFPYSGNEQHWAIAATHNAVFTAGLYETCGFGHYVNVLTHYDLAGNVVARASEPSVDFDGYSCIGSSVGNAIAASTDGALFVAGSSALSGEGPSQAFVARSTGLARYWKTRSAFASDFTAVTWDAGAVYAAGVCSGQACIEKFDAALGTSLWAQSYGSPGSGISGIVAPGNGHIYAVGFTKNGSTDAILIDIAGSTGAQSSIDVYDSGGDDSARGIASNGSDLYVIGDTLGEDSGLFVRRYLLERPQ